ncbi:MAG: RagB/SusD family nutrient uptake outer membrane protein [Capnocytophaga sp.]|nr:RagB/SusD family nutrient uptake outer membrane protein [Capnocytophaga sp.]
MKSTIYKRLTAIWLSVFLTSCNSFLDELPDARTEIDTPEKIQELLVGAYPDALYIDICETMSDNAGDKTNVSESSQLNTDMYLWRTNNEIDKHDTPTFYWKRAYEAIANANQALEYIEQIANEEKYNYLKGEALVARAYAHFMLGVLWCKPYSDTASSDLGLPYVTKPEKKVFEKYERIPLDKFYDAIEKDLTEGLPLIDNSKYSKPKFHFTKEAAHAFASRFYLMKGDWDKVIEHSTEALGDNIVGKLRNRKADLALTYYEIQYKYASIDEPANILIAGANSAYARNILYNKYGLTYEISQSLVDGNHHPLKKYRVRWVYRYFGGTDYRNYPKVNEYFKYDNVSSNIGDAYVMATLFSYDEVLLNRMEAYAMKGERAKFVADLNIYFRPKTSTTVNGNIVESHIDDQYNGLGTELSPAYSLSKTQREWVECVIGMRRVEFVQEGLRWFDIKRMGIKVTHVKDDETLELPKDDPRRELQIPVDAIANGLTPNPR